MKEESKQIDDKILRIVEQFIGYFEMVDKNQIEEDEAI